MLTPRIPWRQELRSNLERRIYAEFSAISRATGLVHWNEFKTNMEFGVLRHFV